MGKIKSRKKSALYKWNEESTYIKEVSFFKDKKHFTKKYQCKNTIKFGDSVTTDHISPAGKFSKTNLQESIY